MFGVWAATEAVANRVEVGSQMPKGKSRRAPDLDQGFEHQAQTNGERQSRPGAVAPENSDQISVSIEVPP